MASGPHTFVTLSVFSPDRFKGNPLAIVAVRGNALSQESKSSIAKEFGYSETVFIHDAPAPDQPRRVDIFTETGEEIPFAGHPLVGVGHYIFRICETSISHGLQDAQRQYTTTVLTKAGPINIAFNAFRQVSACSVPHKFHEHSKRLTVSNILNVQPQIQIIPSYEQFQSKEFPVVSIVKGMSFALIDLTDTPEILAGLRAGKAPEMTLDKEWNTGFVGALYYRRAQVMEQPDEPKIHAIQARMISHGIEDAGTGSACCALACYLSLNNQNNPSPKPTSTEELTEKAANVQLDDKADDKVTTKDGTRTERYVYAIKQGVELGRACTIAIDLLIDVEANGKRSISSVGLSGRAQFFSQGQLFK